MYGGIPGGVGHGGHCVGGGHGGGGGQSVGGGHGGHCVGGGHGGHGGHGVVIGGGGGGGGGILGGGIRMLGGTCGVSGQSGRLSSPMKSPFLITTNTVPATGSTLMISTGVPFQDGSLHC